MVEGNKRRYPQGQLSMDYAISINKCSKKAMPTGTDLEALKTALLALVDIINKQQYILFGIHKKIWR